jgi:Hemerythrin HHE cation binding domain
MPVQIGATAHNFTDPTGLLSDCHRRVEMFLGMLVRVAEVIDRPATEETSRALESALRYFAQAAPKHTADEEQSLFPRLRRIDDPEIRPAFEKTGQVGRGSPLGGTAAHRSRAPGHPVSVYGEVVRCRDRVLQEFGGASCHHVQPAHLDRGRIDLPAGKAGLAGLREDDDCERNGRPQASEVSNRLVLSAFGTHVAILPKGSNPGNAFHECFPSPVSTDTPLNPCTKEWA